MAPSAATVTDMIKTEIISSISVMPRRHAQQAPGSPCFPQFCILPSAFCIALGSQSRHISEHSFERQEFAASAVRVININAHFDRTKIARLASSQLCFQSGSTAVVQIHSAPPLRQKTAVPQTGMTVAAMAVVIADRNVPRVFRRRAANAIE